MKSLRLFLKHPDKMDGISGIIDIEKELKVLEAQEQNKKRKKSVFLQNLRSVIPQEDPFLLLSQGGLEMIESFVFY